MKLKDLLAKLSDLENTLHEFSYERLTAVEAQELKATIEKFRNLLYNKIQQEKNDKSTKELNTVHKIEEETAKSESETDSIAAPNDLAEISSFGSTRFTAYLKESELSNRQLSYINAILAAAEIDTRITNDTIPPDASCSNAEKDRDNSDQQLKNNVMSSTNKKASEKGSASKLDKKIPIKLDLNPILEDCLGKKDLLEELIKLFKQNALEFIGQLKIHIQNHDYEAIRFASHKIKSGLRMMNTRELLVIAEQIEFESRKNQDIKHLKFLYDCFVQEYPLVESAIEEAFKKLD